MTANFTQETFYETLRCHGIELSDKQKQQFDVYAKMLVEWNEKMNLTAITQIDEIYEKHFLDSILPSFVFDISGSLCDVGAGAGFPSSSENRISALIGYDYRNLGEKSYVLK